MCGTKLLCWAKIPILINQGKEYQVAFKKGQREKRFISSSMLPHLEQVSLICLEYLPSLLPVERVPLRSLQANV